MIDVGVGVIDLPVIQKHSGGGGGGGGTPSLDFSSTTNSMYVPVIVGGFL